MPQQGGAVAGKNGCIVRRYSLRIGIGQWPQIHAVRGRDFHEVRALCHQSFNAIDILKPDLAINLPPGRGGVQARDHAVILQNGDHPVHQIGGEAVAPPIRRDQDHADPAEWPVGERHR